MQELDEREREVGCSSADCVLGGGDLSKGVNERRDGNGEWPTHPTGRAQCSIVKASICEESEYNGQSRIWMGSSSLTLYIPPKTCLIALIQESLWTLARTASKTG